MYTIHNGNSNWGIPSISDSGNRGCNDLYACRLPAWIECAPPEGYEICTRDEAIEARKDGSKNGRSYQYGEWMCNLHGAPIMYARKITGENA